MINQNKNLAKGYRAEELAESLVFPSELSKKQKKEADAVLNKALAERRAGMSAEDRLRATLMQLRFQIEDYLNNAPFDKNKGFGFFLKSYIDHLGIKHKKLAEQINIKPAELSLYINNHRTPTENVIVRLELHSHGIISAVDWYRLLEKEKLHELSTNKALRKDQKRFVKKEAELA